MAAWQANLIPIDDLDTALQRRRVRSLLGDHEPDRVRAAYREPDGRYVLVVEHDNGKHWSYAEWPTSLQVLASWTDQTVLAADVSRSGAVTLLALTPAADGRTRTDPVPLSPRSARDAFGYGYTGGSDTPVSQLWHTISTTTCPLRLSWPQLQLWAPDAAAAGEGAAAVGRRVHSDRAAGPAATTAPDREIGLVSISTGRVGRVTAPRRVRAR